MTPGPWQILLIFLVVLLLFGAKRIPEIAGSLAKGIKEFKKVGKDSENGEVANENKSEKEKQV
jgi:sec-independent protein translocase protein TatA